MDITRKLAAQGLNIIAIEPNLSEDKKQELGLSFLEIDSAFNQVDIMVLLVKHQQFKALKFDHKKVVDTCGIL